MSHRFLDEKRTPWLKLLSFVIIWAGIFIVALLKGTRTSPIAILTCKGGEGKASIIGIKCGSLTYWLVVCSLIPFVVFYIMGFGFIVKREYDRKVAVGYPFLDSGKKSS